MEEQDKEILTSIIVHIALMGLIVYIGVFFVWGRITTIETVFIFSFIISLISFFITNYKLFNESETQTIERRIKEKEEISKTQKAINYFILYPIYLFLIFFGLMFFSVLIQIN